MRKTHYLKERKGALFTQRIRVISPAWFSPHKVDETSTTVVLPDWIAQMKHGSTIQFQPQDVELKEKNVLKLKFSCGEFLVLNENAV
ncbi:unnamed protein product [Cylicocyclus nassatus]|uniref:Uncharacterized protein n=1 Tax=Cylicocyclus nassatus TaxID=53992 RepID=A0AA36M4C6_CYLNA|nr:unnamed protein product [Cylicocyclus nassatus]